MRFDASQHIRLGQSLKLAPRMIQSMEILQMSLADLQERIAQELESNPTLEVAEQVGEAAPAADAPERPMEVKDGGSEDFARLEDFERSNPEAAENEFSGRDEPHGREEEYRPVGQRSDDDRDAKSEAIAAAPARGAPLADQLHEQWALCDADQALKPLGELIISALDADGYLRTAIETIADRAPMMMLPSPWEEGSPSPAPGAKFVRARPTAAQLGHALKAVQLFCEPPGVAARDLRECLLLQLDALEDEPGEGVSAELVEHATLIVRDCLDDLGQNRVPRIAEKTGLSIEQVKEALGLIRRRLNPTPALRLVPAEVTPIVPDAVVEYDADQDRYLAYLNETRLPNLRVNQEYANLARDKQVQKKDREFVRVNLANANWLIDAVRQRRQTLLRVLQVVVDAQRDYFDYGPQALKPLPMTQVAEQLGIHVATVSRAVAEKYIQTPRGVVPLRKFFSGGMQTEGGEELAWDAIKQALKEVVESEDKSSPLSDDALAEELKKRGIEIARRTVAKYREQLKIPTARMRKTY